MLGARRVMRLVVVATAAALVAASGPDTCAGPGTPSALKAATFGATSGGPGRRLENGAPEAAAYASEDRPQVALAGRSSFPAPPPENVTVAYHLIDVVRIDESAQQVTVMGYMRYTWNDWRLAYDGDCADVLTYNGVVTNDLWYPTVFMAPLIEDLETTDRPDAVAVLPSGEVSYSFKKTLRFHCKLDFRRMPRDTQRCEILMRTMRETTAEVVFVAGHLTVSPALLNSDDDEGRGSGSITGWSLNGYGAYITDPVDPGSNEWSGDGDFGVGAASPGPRPSCAVWFNLDREAGFFEKYVVVPIFLFVLVAYVTFFVDRASPPARLGGPLVCFLVVVNFSSSVLTYFPRVDYRIKLLDYMLVSMYFCAFAIFEYGLVSMLLKIEKRVDRAKLRTLHDAGIVSLVDQAACLAVLKTRSRVPWLSPRRVSDALAAALDRLHLERTAPPSAAEEIAAEKARATVDDAFAATVVIAVDTAAGRLGRLVTRDGEMFVQDQHVDIAARFLFLPIYFTVLDAANCNVIWDALSGK